MNMKYYALPALLTSLVLTGCGSDSSSNNNSECHDESCFDVSDSGRLVISDADNAAASVINLENNSVMDTFSLTNKASAVYASPGYRYGLAIQRQDDGLVQVIDGGQYQEDHGDHLHPYEQDPSLMSFSVAGANPTHYETHDGHGAIFFDGTGGVVSKVVEFSDEMLAAGNVNAFELATSHHGTAEPLGEHILVSNKGDSTSSLPEKVELFHFHEGDGFESDEVFDAECPSLHGSFTTEEGTVFGCSDGVLVVAEGDNHAFTATKIDNVAEVGDSRIGSFSGYGESHFIAGWAGDNLFAIDLEDMSMELVDWNGDSDAEKNNAHMAATGEFLLVLDRTGTLHILSGAGEHEHEHEGEDEAAHEEEEEHAFETMASVKVIDTMPAPVQGHGGLRQPRVSITSSPSSDFAYIVNSEANEMVVVHLEDGEVEQRIELNFKPAQAAWVGIASAEHDHEEGEGHDHD